MPPKGFSTTQLLTHAEGRLQQLPERLRALLTHRFNLEVCVCVNGGGEDGI